MALLTPAEFDALHQKWCTHLQTSFQQAGVAEVSYGRLAKLLAMYLKVMVVAGPHPDTALATVAPHRPLSALQSREGLKRPAPLQDVQLDPHLTTQDYYELIDLIRNAVPDILPFWQLERYWDATKTPQE